VPGVALLRDLVSGVVRVSRVSWSPLRWFALLFDPARASGPRTLTVLRFRPLSLYGEGQREHPYFVAQSHGFPSRCLRFMPPLSDDDARLAYGAVLLAFRRVLVPLGRRCGVSAPHSVPRLSPYFLSFCLFHSSSFFLVSVCGVSPPPCLCTAPRGQGEGFGAPADLTLRLLSETLVGDCCRVVDKRLRQEVPSPLHGKPPCFFSMHRDHER
jgi:hypothetical protein